MPDRRVLTTESGAPVTDNQRSQTAGPSGPVLLQDQHLIEKLASFNRERIPERVVHARGSGAHGHFEVTSEISRFTRARFLSEVGKRTEVFVRFSTVARQAAHPKPYETPEASPSSFTPRRATTTWSATTPRSFSSATRSSSPTSSIPQKPDPYTNCQEPDNVWDFFSHSPEATHMFTWLFGDRGIPASYRHMNGYGSHTFQWVNAAGEQFFVKYHFKTDQGIKCLTSDQAARLAGSDPESHTVDLMQAIDRGDLPSWTLRVQIMPASQAAGYHLNPFDLTKVWPQGEYPLIEVGKLVLDRNPSNYFADVEQAAFDPAHFVPGIGPSPDKMLQGRLFAYGDAHRYRLGINHTQLPINRPHASQADNYGRDGAMRFDARYGREKNYEPNSYGGPVETGDPLYGSLPGGPSGSYSWSEHEGDDYSQAGSLYGLMPEDAKSRLVDNIAAGLAQVSRDDVVQRSTGNFAKADPDYGARIEAAVKQRL